MLREAVYLLISRFLPLESACKSFHGTFLSLLLRRAAPRRRLLCERAKTPDSFLRVEVARELVCASATAIVGWRTVNTLSTADAAMGRLCAGCL